jgi:hypothetical protein
VKFIFSRIARFDLLKDGFDFFFEYYRHDDPRVVFFASGSDWADIVVPNWRRTLSTLCSAFRARLL